MKNKVLGTLAIVGLSTQLHAGGAITPIEVPHTEVVHSTTAEHTEQGPFYIIVKGLMIAGDTVEHGHDTLEGESGYGFGIDVGYRLGHGFAIEYDFSYATNTITETDDHHHTHEAEATYYTHALDLVYTYHVSHTIGLFAKGGYVYEIEEIDDLHIDTSDEGFTYGIGLEYAMNSHYTFIVEYEGSTIEGPRGDGIFVGVMYSF